MNKKHSFLSCVFYLKRTVNLKDYFLKFKIIIPAFVIIVVTTTLLPLLIRWFFVIKYDFFEVKEELWTLYLPFVLPWIPILIFLRPRLRVIKFKKYNENRIFLFQLITWVTLIAMMMSSQNYLTTSSGKITILNKIDDINNYDKTRYYSIRNIEVRKDKGLLYTDYSLSGKYSEHLNVDFYFVIPIFSNNNNQSEVSNYWFGKKYHKQISDRKSDDVKDSLINVFYKASIKKLNKLNFNYSTYFERIPKSDDRNNYLKAISKTKPSKDLNNFIILVPKTKYYEDRNGNKFGWIFKSFGIGLLIILLLLIWPNYSRKEHKNFFER